jgi:hypothetical protein
LRISTFAAFRRYGRVMTMPDDSSVPGQQPGFGAPGYRAPGGSGPAVAPRQVVTAFWLYIAAAVLSLVSLVVSLATFGGMRDVVARQLANEGVKVSDSAINALLGVTIGISILFAVIWIAAFVLFAIFMKRGANWARIVLTVITALSLVNILSGFGLGALQVVVSVIATILIWLRPASEYFTAVKARRGGGQAY